MSLDRLCPLTSAEVHRLSDQIRHFKPRHEIPTEFIYSPRTPDIDLTVGEGRNLRCLPVSGSPQNPEERGCAAEVSPDYSVAGYWVFDPSVRALYSTHKVGVRVRSKDRAGYITGDLEEDHSSCSQKHDRCRVTVNLNWGRSVISTAVSASDIEPCRPVKKNQKVLQVRGLQGAPARKLIATGVSRIRDQPITVVEPGKEKQAMYIPAYQLTTLDEV